MPTTLRKVSCWPANEASGRSSAVAEERTATAMLGLPRGQLLEGARTAASSCGRERRLDGSSGGSSRPHAASARDVVDVEVGEAPRRSVGQTVLREEIAVGVRRGGEAAGHAHAGVGQVADHFAEGGVLAADRLDVGHPQLFERSDQGGRQGA